MTHSRLSLAIRLFASSLLVPALAQAAVITADGTLCTLADAIRAANTDLVAGGCTAGSGADTIQLTADESITFTEASASGSSTIFGGIAGLPDVVTTITIQAIGAGDRIERQAGLLCASEQPDAFRIFNVLGAGNLTLAGITVANGCIAPGGVAFGGAFYIAATGALSLQQSTVTGNTARGNDGAVVGSVGFGGAIYAEGGTLTFTLSTFADNLARAGDGPVAGGFAQGGVLEQQAGVLTAIGTIFSGNSAIGGSGGAGGGALGGALFLNTAIGVTIDTSAFLGNSARGGDGTTSAGDAAGGALMSGASISALTDSTFAENVAEAGNASAAAAAGAYARGGAILLEGGAQGVFERLIVRDNRAEGGAASSGGPAVGGGLYHLALSLAALRDSHFSGNIVRGGSGALAGGAAVGGGLAAERPLTEISGSTFNDNLAEGGAGGNIGAAANGGGIYIQSSTALLMINTTVVANVARGGSSATLGGLAAGGGVIGGSALAVLRHVTVTGNQAVSEESSDGGGIAGTFVIDNSVLADNLVTGESATGPDCSGSVVSGGFNHAEAPGASCVFAAAGDVVGSDPLLGPFGDHGCTADRVLPDGSCAPTVALLLTSLPLDAGSCTVSGATVDERGFPRPVDIAGVANAADACDKGAFELQALETGVDLNVTKSGPVTNPPVSAAFSFLLSVTNQSTIAAGTGITVTDPVPAGLFYTGSTCGAVEAGGVVTWTIGTLAPGAVVSCSFTFQRLARSAISNQATVDGNEVDPDSTDNIATAQLEALAVAEIPTLGEWAMLLMTLSLAALAVSRLRG